MTQNLNQAHYQWANRPDDERFLDLRSLYSHVVNRKENSFVNNQELHKLQVAPSEDGDLFLASENDTLIGKMSNWTFSQLCTQAKAPAKFLKKLPATIASIPLNYQLTNVQPWSAQLLVNRDNLTNEVRALTSQTYGRIWDKEVVEAISTMVGNDWKVPLASYSASDPLRATTLYASDRDVWIFLVNENHMIEFEGRQMARGFFAWNSEVGKSVFGLTTFLYDYVCDNRIVWGAENVNTLRIRHTSGGPLRFAREAQPALQAYLQGSTDNELQMLRRTSSDIVAADEKKAIAWLKKKGFPVKMANRAVLLAQQEQTDTQSPFSRLNMVNGLTAAARDIPHTDQRIAVEMKAGSLLAE